MRVVVALICPFYGCSTAPGRCNAGYIVKLEVGSSKAGSKATKNAQQVSLHDGNAWAVVKYYDEVRVPVPVAAPAPAATSHAVASQCLLRAGARVGAYFNSAEAKGTFYEGAVHSAEGGICVVQFEDEPWEYPVAMFVHVPFGQPTPTCQALRGRPCLFLEAAPASAGQAAHAAGQSKQPKRPAAPKGANTGRHAASQGSRQQLHERRAGSLVYRMPVSSKHGLNFRVNVANSIISPVRLSMAADGTFLLHCDDERYAYEHVQRMNEEPGKATERAETDFAARKSKFPMKRQLGMAQAAAAEPSTAVAGSSGEQQAGGCA